MNYQRETQMAIDDIIIRVEELKCELDNLLHGTDLYPHYKAYGRYGFDQLLGNGNPYDEGLFSIKNNLMEGNYCEDCGSEVEGEDTYCDHCNSIFEEQSNELANEEE